MISKLGVIAITMLSIRGILGIYQDCNYFFKKPFNLETIKGWFQTFERVD